MQRFVFTALALAAMTAASPAAAQGACNRELLQGVAGDWVSALEKGTPFEMQLGEWSDYRENLELGFMSAFFDKPRKVEWHRAFLDTTTCKAFVESVILDDERPLVLSTQLTNGFFGVSPIDNIVTEKGDWKFDVQGTLTAARAENWAEIPTGSRMSRADLTAAANAWLDARAAQGATTTERAYLVDEVYGAVNVLARLGEKRLPASYTLRIENGAVSSARMAVDCGAEANCAIPGGDLS